MADPPTHILPEIISRGKEIAKRLPKYRWKKTRSSGCVKLIVEQ